ncbi:hypothetical protein LWI29_003299 [Acer saccharum]|uniref:Retroviral polymerase SH3-like domain-containing protein n=1 Tax=Acer saccharum TaxID=4024 RepID=A0AA39UZD8_ACESA|nr:hypothetical protein LWI29_003299 [Acer saccharum]
MKCIFLGYPDGVKGYRFWNLATKKCIISRNVIFKEDELPGLKNSITSSSNTPIEVEQSGFEVELTGKNFEQDHDQLQVPVQSVNDSDEVVVQHNDLEDYNLTRDRVRREVRAPNRFGYADIVAYALQVAGEIRRHEEKEATGTKNEHRSHLRSGLGCAWQAHIMVGYARQPYMLSWAVHGSPFVGLWAVHAYGAADG